MPRLPDAARVADADAALPTDFGRAVDFWAARRPDQLAWADDERRCSWQEAAERVARLADWLVRQGVGPGDRIALWLANRSAVLEAIFAAARVGAIALPINARLTPLEVAFQLGDATPRLLFVERSFRERAEEALDALKAPRPLCLAVGRVSGVDAPTDCAYERALAGADPAAGMGIEPPSDPDAPMILMYTSGTTGLPKGALLPHRKTLANCRNARAGFELTAGDRVLVVTPLFHSLGLQILALPACYCGAAVVIQEGFDPRRAWRAVAQEGITLLGAVPTAHQRLLEALGPDPMPSLRLVFTAGAAAPIALLRAYHDRGIAMVQGYGQTETSMLTCQTPASALLKAGSVGRPLPLAELRLIEPSTLDGPVARWRDVGIGEVGEIVVRGPLTMLGYWQRPEATRETLRGDWLRTGDLATRDADFDVTLVGRAREMYISGGENVYPAEVEAVLEGHPAIAEAAVVAVPDATWGEVGRAHLVARPGIPLDLDALAAWLAPRLARFKQPRSYVLETALPRTASGKVQKHRLLAMQLLAALLGLVAFACSDDSDRGGARLGAPTNATDPRAANAPANEEDPTLEADARRFIDARDPIAPGEPALFFGDLHVHTAWSFDAFDHGVRTEPGDAYRFARGEKIPHAAGGEIALTGPPLDFLAVTDHAEYLGVTLAALRASHPLHSQPLIQTWLSDDPARVELATRRIRQTLQGRRALPALVADDVFRSAWQENVAAANAHDRPGVFSALIGFEYTSNPDRQNLHRNVIFRGGKVPERPHSAFDSENPEDLWDWMDAARGEGDDLIAIPHNANGSNGLMFAAARFDGSAIDADWAAQRIRNEPLAELFQIKGQSETSPRLSPDDAWADFEVVGWQTIAPERPSRESGSYVREALARGLALRETLGVDPFAVGVVGSTDTHNSASPIDEARYFGKLGVTDGTPAKRLERSRTGDAFVATKLGMSAYWSAAGLAGIWAPENTRAALFDAMRRRETFATSGPRIRVRVKAGFENAGEAVPMGGLLRTASGAASPRFELLAQQDPREAPLERIQLIKLWRTADGSSRERIYDAACRDGRPPDASSHRCASAAPAPDPASCRVDRAAGARELAASWRDPDFDPAQAALYSVRVLQVPTCRWTSFDAKALGQAPPSEVPATIQERAITSPIWVLPEAPVLPTTPSASAPDA